MSISDQEFEAWLKSAGDERRVVLVEAKAYSSGVEVTRYLATKGYVSAPSDTPANQVYDGIVNAVPYFTDSIPEVFGGTSRMAWGDIAISNANGDRDAWLDDGWDGRDLALYLGDARWPKADFRSILVGQSADIVAKDRANLALRIRDKSLALSVPLQTNLIGGSSANKNKVKPVCYGAAFNVEPPLTDDSTHEYQAHDGAINDVTDVRDEGVSLTKSGITVSAVNAGTDTLTASANHGFSLDTRVVFGATPPSPLVAGTTYWVITAGLTNTDFRVSATKGGSAVDITSSTTGASISGKNWNVDTATGKLTLAAAPAGQITCDVQGAKPGGTYLTKCADIVKDLITSRTILSVSDIDASNFTGFNTTCAQALEYYAQNTASVASAIDELVKSVGGFWTFGLDGKMVLGQFEAPSGTPDIEIIADDIQRWGLGVANRFIPTSTLRLGYKKNYTVQDSGLAGSVTEANRALYGAEYQAVTSTNAGVTTAHKLAENPPLEGTHLTDATEVQTECDRQATLWSVIRYVYQVSAYLAPYKIRLGQVMSITHPRFGFSSGKLCTLVGYTWYPSKKRAMLQVFA